jgi:predicted metal-dependent phosphoesterase TrpH
MTPGPRLDLHVHSSFSPDGRASIDELVGRLAALGLEGLAVTDHNTLAGLRRVHELRRERPELLLLPGVEVSAAEGHLLVYGLDEVPPPHRPAAEVIDWARARGGVPVLAHPFRRTHGVGAALARGLPVAAIETTNGHNGPRSDARARDVAAGRGLGTTGGSDAHVLVELGRAWTRFPDDARTVDDLLRALTGGRTAAEGRSATLGERCRIALRSGALRLRRGLRPL